MRTVTRTEYYDFIQALRAKTISIKITRTIHLLEGLEHIVEHVSSVGGQKAQAVSLGNEASYIIIED